MNGKQTATEPIPLTLAARSAGIPVRTLRNWIASGKLAAIRGQRGWLVRTSDIAQIAAMLSSDAANPHMADGMAADLAASVAAPVRPEREDAANAANAAAMSVLDQRVEAEALVQQLLAPFIAEQTRLAEELGQVKAERDQLRVEVEALRHQASPQPLSATPPPDAATATPEAPGRAGGLWARVRRVFGGAG